MPQYKLTYFNCKGLGEAIRFLFAYGNIAFEDNRIEESEWPALKTTMPLGQMPILEFDGVRAFQSVAIARYVAKEVGLAGANSKEDLQIDLIVDTIAEMRSKMSDYYWDEDKASQQVKLEPLQKMVPLYMGRLESFAKENNGHLVAGKLTWADIYFVASLDYCNYMMERSLVEDYPSLKQLVETVKKIENIAKWIAKRPHTDY